jgi:hypothetical protein
MMDDEKSVLDIVSDSSTLLIVVESDDLLFKLSVYGK